MEVELRAKLPDTGFGNIVGRRMNSLNVPILVFDGLSDRSNPGNLDSMIQTLDLRIRVQRVNSVNKVFF